jgi:hypothetical protein
MSQMSDFDQNRHPLRPSSATIWGLAALSAALFFCSVLAAKLLGDMVESGLTRLAAGMSVPGDQKMARSAIDPTATGSIRVSRPAPSAVTAAGKASR